MKPLSAHRHLTAQLLLALLPSCSSLPGIKKEPQADVVYALGSRDGFTSPLNGTLKPACQALDFAAEDYALTAVHRRLLTPLVQGWAKDKPRYLIAGYSPPGLPEDFARTLSERRAQAVRQHLIESGLEAASLQSVGFGFRQHAELPDIQRRRHLPSVS